MSIRPDSAVGVTYRHLCCVHRNGGKQRRTGITIIIIAIMLLDSDVNIGGLEENR